MPPLFLFIDANHLPSKELSEVGLGSDRRVGGIRVLAYNVIAHLVYRRTVEISQEYVYAHLMSMVAASRNAKPNDCHQRPSSLP